MMLGLQLELNLYPRMNLSAEQSTEFVAKTNFPLQRQKIICFFPLLYFGNDKNIFVNVMDEF